MSSNQVLSAIGSGSAEDPWSRFDIRDPFTEYPLPLPRIEENVVEGPSPEDSTDLRNKINVLEGNVMELRAETHDGRKKLEAMEVEIQNLRKQIDEQVSVQDQRVEELGEESRRNVAALTAEIGDLRKDLAVLEEQNGTLQRKVTPLEEEVNDLRDQVLSLDNRVEKLVAENEIFKRKVTALEEENRRLRKSLETVQRNQNKFLEKPLAIGSADSARNKAESSTHGQVGYNDDHSSSSNEAVARASDDDDGGSNPATPSTSTSVEMNGIGGNENQEDGIMMVEDPLRQTPFSQLDLDVVEDRNTGGHSSTNPITPRRTTRKRFPSKKLGFDVEDEMCKSKRQHIAPSVRNRVGKATSRRSGFVDVEEQPKDAGFIIEDPEEVSAEVLINDKVNETGTSAARKSKRTKSMEVESSGKGPKYVSGSSRQSTWQEWLPRQSDGKYHCPHCPKTYSGNRQRNRHLESHSPKQCKVCKRTYLYAITFKRHLKTCGNLVKDKQL